MIETILYISGGLFGLLAIWLLDRIHSRLVTVIGWLQWYARWHK